MDSKELRIGNLVLSNNPLYRKDWLGKVLSILEIKDESVSVVAIDELPYAFTGGQFLKYIDPLPLTEEILLRCGFSVKKSPILDFYHISISWNGDYKEISLSIELGNQYVYLREQNDELPNDRLADNVVCIFNGDIHGKLYLHKLQNIIHALTSTELEINL